MDLLFDWEEDRDRYSFEDSDRFEDDSFCSWISEPESLCNNWRGWRKPNNGLGNAPASGNYSVQFFPTTLTASLVASVFPNQQKSSDVQLHSLVELTAKAVACYIPFEVVEHFYPPIPEQLQLRIAFWSFPENEDDIRLYSCLANGSADEFVKGEFHYKTKCISDVLQIGFHLSGSVTPAHFNKGPYSVAVTFDRRHITSCTCTCNSTASWCSHVVALCLFRIHQSSSVCLRAPVSESLSRLGRDQLQKFAQYLISELPQHFLPTAQRLLDELLSSQRNDINTVCGAPDPTAGPSATEQTTWCLDEAALHENIKKTLVKFCIPSPVVLSDVNYLSSNSPPAATEYQSLLRPLRGREPEGIWNLLLIIREMFKRHDSNSIPLLEILTEEILECDMILTWWYNNKMITNYHSQHHPNSHHYYQSNPSRLSGGGGSGQAGSSVTQHAASSLCDELVALWRLATLNPSLASTQQHDLAQQLRDYHINSLEKLYCRNRGQLFYGKDEMEAFPGFKPAFEACLLDWNVLKPPNLEEHDDVPQLKGSSPFWMRSLMKIRSDGETLKIVHAKGNSNKDSNHPSCLFLNSLSSSYPLKGGEGNSNGETHLLEMEELSSTNVTVSQFADQSYFADIRKVMGMQEIKFAVAEALYAHGHLSEASELARELAEEMLANCQASDQNQSKHVASDASDKRKKMQANNPAFQMLANASFLCSVLLENTHNNLIAFKIGIYALEMNRPPAPTKQLEVKLAYQESELANQLKKIPLTTEELNIIRDRAEKLKDGRIKSRGEAVLPITLAAFIFDSLCLSGNKPGTTVLTTSVDEKLGFEAAVIALGLKANVSEAEHPLLCEGLRRQRGELAIALLVHCKDDPAKLARVMDKILDRDVHQLYKTPPPWYAYLNESPATTTSSSLSSSSSSNVSSSSAVSSSTALNLPPPVNTASFPSSSSTETTSVAQPSTTTTTSYCSTTPTKPLSNGTKKTKPGVVVQNPFPPPLRSVALQLSQSSPKAQEVSSTLTVMNAEGVAKKLSSQLKAKDPQGAIECSSTQQNDAIQSSQVAEAMAGNSESSNAVEYPDGGPGQAVSMLDATEQQLQSSEKNHFAMDDDFTGTDDDVNGRSKYKEWEAKFRCTNLKTVKKPSIGMASVDSSAPETTSSDNSPTLSRRTIKQPSGSPHHHHHLNPCPDSDSGSSHESFDFNNSDLQAGSAPSRDADSPPINQLFENIYQPQQLGTVHTTINSLMNAKVTRYKGKNRIMPLLPNQPSEALAHFMFELAKTILIKAGGNVSTSLFTQHSINFQNSSSSNNATSGNNSGNSNAGPNGPHRALHLCAFQIGLYALGLNNRVSPNWISRTYSSLVSWINGQATEIGPSAIKILTQAWENHLTPQEAASLADRASRCRDPTMVSAAAELALSCLSFASFLNTNEIHIALNQCKDQSSEMLQRACLSVEMAAKDGGVHSEVLFEIAKRWYELYTGPATAPTTTSGFHADRRNASNPPTEHSVVHMPPVVTSQREELNVGLMDSRMPTYPRAPYTLQQYSFQPQQLFYHQPPQQSQQTQAMHHQQHYLASQPSQPYLSAPPFSYLSIHPTPSSNSVVAFPSSQNPYFPQHQVIRHRGGQQIVQMNLAPHVLPIQVQTPPSYQIAFVGQNNAGVAPGTWPQVFGYQQYPVDSMQPGVMLASLPPPSALHLQQVPSLQSSLPPSTQYTPQLPTSGVTTSTHSGSQGSVTSSVVYFLYAAYRVGMLAMEALARKVHDDRPQVKFSRNPPYGEDVKWLLEVSIKLGTTHVQQFCASTCSAVLSPFILSDVAIDMAKAFSNGNINQINQNLRIPFIQSLLQKSSQMFVQCTHARIHHIVPQDYEEFINILCSARKVFLLIPDGQTQFNELINGLKRSKSCKKDLWQRIVGLLN